jgi:hypothetical protein
MDFYEPVDQDGSHLVIDLDLVHHVVAVNRVSMLSFQHVLENSGGVLGAFPGVRCILKIYQMEIAALACQFPAQTANLGAYFDHLGQIVSDRFEIHLMCPGEGRNDLGDP